MSSYQSNYQNNQNFSSYVVFSVYNLNSLGSPLVPVESSVMDPKTQHLVPQKMAS